MQQGELKKTGHARLACSKLPGGAMLTFYLPMGALGPENAVSGVAETLEYKATWKRISTVKKLLQS